MCFIDVGIEGIVGYLFGFKVEVLNVDIFIVQVIGYVGCIYDIVDIVGRVGGSC